jgi:enoyl-CoA hydratase/carnithine racemase
MLPAPPPVTVTFIRVTPAGTVKLDAPGAVNICTREMPELLIAAPDDAA